MVTHVKRDITKVEADVIINAANTELTHGGGVARAIAKAAGREFIKESREAGFCPLGDFVVTSAGNLKAKEVVHIPTIDYLNEGQTISYEDLESVWVSVLDYCLKKGYKTVAVPLLGTGAAGLKKQTIDEILSRQGMKVPDLEIIIVEP